MFKYLYNAARSGLQSLFASGSAEGVVTPDNKDDLNQDSATLVGPTPTTHRYGLIGKAAGFVYDTLKDQDPSTPQYDNDLVKGVGRALSSVTPYQLGKSALSGAWNIAHDFINPAAISGIAVPAPVQKERFDI